MKSIAYPKHFGTLQISHIHYKTTNTSMNSMCGFLSSGFHLFKRKKWIRLNLSECMESPGQLKFTIKTDWLA